MKPIVLAAILMLSIVLVPTALFLERSIQTVKAVSPTFSANDNYVINGPNILPNDPGSGGGGQGVLHGPRR